MYLGDGVEVARIELENTVHIGHYEGAPQLGSAALAIQLIEVSSAVPACGSGGRVPILSRPACRAVEIYGISYTTILSAMPRSAASF